LAPNAAKCDVPRRSGFSRSKSGIDPKNGFQAAINSSTFTQPGSRRSKFS
jgi:hypothetical protein